MIKVLFAVSFLGRHRLLRHHGNRKKKRFPWLKPPALKPGDTIALVAPAGPAGDDPHSQIREAARKSRLQAVILPLRGRAEGGLPRWDSTSSAPMNSTLRCAMSRVRAIMALPGRLRADAHPRPHRLRRVSCKDPKIITGFLGLDHALHLATARQGPRHHVPCLPRMPMGQALERGEALCLRGRIKFRRAVFAASYPKGEKGYAASLFRRIRPARSSSSAAKESRRLVGGNLLYSSVPRWERPTRSRRRATCWSLRT